MTTSVACCAGLGYTELEIAQLISEYPGLMVSPSQVEDTHTQLGSLFAATPDAVRTLVLKDHLALIGTFDRAKWAPVMELWCEQTGNPPHTMLEIPNLFSCWARERVIMRLCFLYQHGRTLEPPWAELNTYGSDFCQLLGVSEAKVAAWFATWVHTRQAQRFGAVLPL